ncbi:hypothetical protein Y1Q_0004918 [Alligator mississippiensis]|uniref:Uncharacterized protein n=1 Tax=Alligator mississippiensis TaxID=8496 RepID=A0A151MYG5_ALLMI|nr:hypothetical protein Y1Q_0004918 [Alligator mississippiensis]
MHASSDLRRETERVSLEDFTSGKLELVYKGFAFTFGKRKQVVKDDSFNVQNYTHISAGMLAPSVKLIAAQLLVH